MFQLHWCRPATPTEAHGVSELLLKRLPVLSAGSGDLVAAPVSGDAGYGLTGAIALCVARMDGGEGGRQLHDDLAPGHSGRLRVEKNPYRGEVSAATPTEAHGVSEILLKRLPVLSAAKWAKNSKSVRRSRNGTIGI